MKFEINGFFFRIWVELVTLYTHHDYAHCAFIIIAIIEK